MRPIDGDALRNTLEAWGKRLTARASASPLYEDRNAFNMQADIVYTMLDKIERMPTIDAESVRHGRWERDEGGIYCPYCKYIPQWDDDKYCGNCGAKMDGESDAK